MAEKIAVVTGASRGIGRETAMALKRRGYTVVGTYNLGRKEAAEMENRGIAMVHLDLSDRSSISNAAREIGEKVGTVDALVNNGAVISWKPFAEMSPSEIEKLVDVNLKGTMLFTREMLGYINKRGVIANVASGAGKTAYPGLSVYCATKFGLRGFTQALAREMPEMRIFSFNPGLTATRMTNFQGDDPAKVAEVLAAAIDGEISPDENFDVDVWEYL